MLRNIMGLLANIAEVSSLRGALMRSGILDHLIHCMDTSQVCEKLWMLILGRKSTGCILRFHRFLR